MREVGTARRRQLDARVRDDPRRHDDRRHQHLRPRGHAASRARCPAPLNYHGFPEERVHVDQRGRVPRHPGPARAARRRHHQRRRHHIYEGFHGDTSATFYIGTPSAGGEARDRGRAPLARARHRRGARGRAPRRHRRGDPGVRRGARAARSSRDFVGHGIGRKFHETPQVAHYGKRGTGMRLKAGMSFTIEPMINLGALRGARSSTTSGPWSRADGSLSAQFEHTDPRDARPVWKCSLPAPGSCRTARSSRTTSRNWLGRVPGQPA